MNKLKVVPMTQGTATGDVQKADILAALSNTYGLKLKAEGVRAVDIIFFGQGDEKKSASEIFFGKDEEPVEKGKVHPHHHEPGEMELVICFLNDGKVIINVVGDRYKHVYPDGVKFAIAVKCTDREVLTAWGTIGISEGN